ncbi:hypothetical protein FNV43_RR16171 [Rhamnella rubrinervis]|uniref:Subtilisin-like protease SBT4.14 n=1 Tax=Rhamnella rubrinervis TaxID=2594499 RepID=A0A8K0GYG4_9ROSA|nr:hypothetical protein FNV43_RR16171 [Rhamnella rubrinervis]
MWNKNAFPHRRSLPSCLLLILLLMMMTIIMICPGYVKGFEEKKFYIVFLGDNDNEDYSAAQKAHIHLLSSVKGSYVDAKESIVHSYTKSFNAFAAKLSSDEVNKLSRMEQVLSVIPNRYHKLHTTRSWDFIGLPLTARRNLQGESNIVVGVFDTGITPSSDSFNDDGFGPPPAKWKGACAGSANFSGCNKKFIGARYFKLDGIQDPADILSPIDVDGHGTHISSTLAGNLVSNASLYGLAKGTARGAVPSARVAMYKVCWVTSGCSDMDILAAYEAAIDDGVDVISISIGGVSSEYTGSIAVGAFHALKKGIITLASAGNDGPGLGSLANHAPWLVTVAASGIDRAFRSNAMLGKGLNVSGVGVSTFNPEKPLYPLVSGADIAMNARSKENARFCIEESLDPEKVKGNLVLCKLGSSGVDSVVKRMGGTGTILESEQFLDDAKIFMAPATIVNTTTANTINNYIHSSRSASAVIYKSHEVQTRAPFVASFSSRGPNPGSQRLLKPDIAAPGVNILASYTLLKSLTGLPGDTQFSKFTLMSGSSISCPHVAGVAAYIKSFYPNWSPAAIRSAIITTAQPMSRRVNNEAEFAYGAGQVNPRKAVNPGLVYDTNELGYIQFLCHEGYGWTLDKLVGSKSINCSSIVPGLGYDAINYPTFQVSLRNKKQTTVAVFRRTVTNVGPAISVYNATIRAPKGIEIKVEPTSLSFTRKLQRRSFKLVVKAKPTSTIEMVSASLGWKSFRHTVRSPIVIYTPFE